MIATVCILGGFILGVPFGAAGFYWLLARKWSENERDGR
jgi:hypothetical protein